MKNSQLVYVKVRLWISCAADVQEVTSEMDYRFNHVDIIDTEIVDVIEPEKPPTWVFKDLSSADEKEYRSWARLNYVCGGEISSDWHPIVIDECRVISTNATKSRIYKYECFGETLSFAEDLGWIDTYPDNEDDGWTCTDADECETEAIMWIESKGFVVVGYDDD